MMKSPKIRFKGFDGDWEQRKFSEIASRESTAQESSRYFPSVEYEDVITEAGRLNKDVNQKEVVKKGIVFDGSQVLYGKLRPYLHNWLNPDFSGVAVGDWWVLKPIDTDKSFLYRLVQTQQFDDVANQSAGSKMPRADWSFVSNSEFAVPVSQDEQTMIGEYFSSLDTLITLHQKKFEQLTILKKYMLQKMFPQNGSDKPEIRFEGFTDDWEQRKFCDFTWDAGKRNKENLNLVPYAITNEHGFIPQSEAHDEFGYMKDTDRRAYNIVEPNSFAYNPARINVGSLGYYEGTENVIVSSLYEVFKTAEYVDDRFLWHWLKSPELPKWIGKLQEGSVRLYFYYDKLCECVLQMPSVEEQRKISKYLDSLDHLITLHQQKCDELRNAKKFMLQNMFI